jgi:glycerophosphoryl diester phosphodiesterase
VRTSWRADSKRPLIVAHRGSSGRAPENTLAAFDRAIEDEADAIELDVRLSKDREIVVCHDASVDRCSDGSGKLSALTLRELKQFSAGAWYGRRFTGEKIPTLAEVYERYGERIAINVELKAGRFDRDPALVDRCCALIDSFHLRDSILITSFHHSLIALLKRHRPDIPAGLLLHPAHILRRSVRAFAERYGIDYLVIGGGSLRKAFIEDAHGYHVKIGEYTVNTERRLQRGLRYNLDAVITDHPKVIRSFIN